MLFPMDKLHVSETWHELIGGIHNTNLNKDHILKLLMVDALDVLFCKEQKAWFIVGYMATQTMDSWRVMHILTGWSFQGGLTRKLLMDDLLKYAENNNVSAILYNHGCPWLMSFSGGAEWLRLK